MKQGWITEIEKSTNRLMLLDYDGTLVEFQSRPEDAMPSWELLRLLENLNDRTDTKVVIVTGRSSESVDELFLFPPFEIIAEHGVKRRMDNKWERMYSVNAEWKGKVRPVLEKFTQLSDGSFVEEKDTALAWHYRNCEDELAKMRVQELFYQLRDVVHQENLKILDGKKVVEILNMGTGKGNAVLKLAGESEYDCILCIGDDNTDEEMFNALNFIDYAYTVKVGPGNTAAKYRIGSVAEVIAILKQMET